MENPFYKKALESNDLNVKNHALQRADEHTRASGLKRGTHSKGEKYKTLYGSARESDDLKVKNDALKFAMKFMDEGEEERTAGTNSWDKKASEKFKQRTE